MKNFIKILTISFILTIGFLGFWEISFGYDISKLTKADILSDKIIKDEKGNSIIEILIKTDKLAGTNIISPNTEQLEPNKYKIYSEDNFYNDNGVWKLTEKATTTITDYSKITTSIWEKLGLYTKVLASYFYGGVDGRVYKQDSAVWATTHDATTGTADTSSASNPLKVGLTATPYFHIGRGYFNFDTSAITDSDTIDTATFNLYVISKANGDNDGQDYFNIYGNTTATDNAIIGDDYDQTGTTEYATAIDLGVITTSAYNTWTFNGTGTSTISKTGYTKLAVKEGHDVENTAYAGSNNTFNELNVYFSEQTGTTTDPYLTITTITGGGTGTTSTTTTTTTNDTKYLTGTIIILGIFLGADFLRRFFKIGI